MAVGGGVAGAGEGCVEEVRAGFLDDFGGFAGGGEGDGGGVDDGFAFGEGGEHGVDDFLEGFGVADEDLDDVGCGGEGSGVWAPAVEIGAFRAIPDVDGEAAGAEAGGDAAADDAEELAWFAYADIPWTELAFKNVTEAVELWGGKPL